MGRKKIYDENSHRVSLQVSGETMEVLNNLTKNYSSKYSPMINKILETFCRMSEKPKKVIEEALLGRYKFLCHFIEETDNNDKFWLQRLNEEKDSIFEILKLINGGVYEVEKNAESIKSRADIINNEMFGDRKRLQNGNGFYFGTAGNGRAFKFEGKFEEEDNNA